jgi:hypothetical protein
VVYSGHVLVNVFTSLLGLRETVASRQCAIMTISWSADDKSHGTPYSL